MIKTLIKPLQAQERIAYTHGGEVFPLSRANTMSAQAKVVDSTPEPVSLFGGTTQVQVIDFVADVAGSLNNKYFFVWGMNVETQNYVGFYVWFNINGAGVDPGPFTDKTGVEITEATNASATDLVLATKAALDLLTDNFAPCGASTFHLTVTASMAGAVPAASAQNSGFTVNAPSPFGVDSGVRIFSDTLVFPDHGYVIGTRVRISSTGTLPTGIVAGIDYFIRPADGNQIQLSSSLANALIGSPVDITSTGGESATLTMTAQDLATAEIQFQVSNDGVNWADEGSSTTVTGTGAFWIEVVNPSGKLGRVLYSLSSGNINSDTTVLLKGNMP